MAEAPKVVIPKKGRQNNNDGAGNESDSTVDYNPANNRKHGGKGKCFGCSDVIPKKEVDTRSGKTNQRDRPVSNEIDALNAVISSSRRRRRNLTRRTAFMRGYRPNASTASSGNEQSDPMDGSDHNGRRVRRRMNGTSPPAGGRTDSDSIYISSDDGDNHVFDTGGLKA